MFEIFATSMMPDLVILCRQNRQMDSEWPIITVYGGGQDQNY